MGTTTVKGGTTTGPSTNTIVTTPTGVDEHWQRCRVGSASEATRLMLPPDPAIDVNSRRRGAALNAREPGHLVQGGHRWLARRPQSASHAAPVFVPTERPDHSSEPLEEFQKCSAPSVPSARP